MKVDLLLNLEDHVTDNDLLFKGKDIPAELCKNLSKIELIDGIFYSLPDSYSGKLSDLKTAVKRPEEDDLSFWENLFEKTESDHIIKIFCDSPFLDTSIIEEMIHSHIDNLAEFTYSENLPAGCTCEIISKELIASLPETDEKTISLSSVIKSNINQFDVELFYKKPDLRNFRISFRSSDPRELRIMEQIHSVSNGIPSYIEIADILNEHPEILYTGPSYLELELTGRCDLNCIFCYRNSLPEVHGDMEVELFKKILSDMHSFSLPYSVCFGGSGEPLMHKKFYEIIGLARDEKLIKNIVIETNGIYADDNFKAFLHTSNDPRIKVIFNLNGFNEKTYSSLHKSDDFQKVFKNVTSIVEMPDDCREIYIQVMKINETEGFLDEYYDFWDSYKVPIILQQQNTYLGQIEDRRYSDLSPVERTFCWHLSRDLYILSDGRVGFCKQDINGTGSSSIIENDLKDIWESRKKYFINDYRKEYAKTPDCKSCDEWYRFNL